MRSRGRASAGSDDVAALTLVGFGVSDAVHNVAVSSGATLGGVGSAAPWVVPPPIDADAILASTLTRTSRSCAAADRYVLRAITFFFSMGIRKIVVCYVFERTSLVRTRQVPSASAVHVTVKPPMSASMPESTVKWMLVCEVGGVWSSRQRVLGVVASTRLRAWREVSRTVTSTSVPAGTFSPPLTSPPSCRDPERAGEQHESRRVGLEHLA